MTICDNCQKDSHSIYSRTWIINRWYELCPDCVIKMGEIKGYTQGKKKIG